jgi:tetratricopeptide (TPR) repeat protein
MPELLPEWTRALDEAAAHINNKRWDDAHVLLNRLVSNGVRHPAIPANVGLLSLAKGDYVDAERSFREALALDATLDKVRRLLGYVLLRQGRPVHAFETFALLFRSPAAEDLGRLAGEALSVLAKVSVSAKDTSSLLLVLGQRFLARGDHEAAAWCVAASGPESVRTSQFKWAAYGPSLPDYCREVRAPLFEAPDQDLVPLVPEKGSKSFRSFVAGIPGGGVLGHTFIPLSPDGRLLYMQVTQNDSKLKSHRASEWFEEIALGSSKGVLLTTTTAEHRKGASVLLGQSSNIGHWLYNHLARLMFVEQVPQLKNLPLIVRDPTAQQLEMFQLLGIEEDQLFRMPAGRIVSFDTLWVPSMPFFGMEGPLYWNSDLLRYLRARLMKGEPKAAGRRLFITRQNARWRRLRNEASVVGALGKYGFEVVDPGSLTIRQQIDIASSAEIIVGILGAGMNLLLFAPANIPIVELKYRVPSMDVTAVFSKSIGQSHYAVWGRPLAMTNDEDLNSDFEVDAAAVERLVEELLT